MGRRHRDDRVELPIIVDGGAVEPSRSTDGSPDPAGDGSHPTARARTDAHVLAASAIVALAIVASIAVATRSGEPARPPTSTRPPALSPIAAPDPTPPAGDRDEQVPATYVLPPSRTVVGTIDWTRFDGGEELPARIGLDVEGSLVGSDDDLGWWRPIEVEDPTRWIRAQSLDREIGEERWRLRRVDGALGLTIITPFGWEKVRLDKLIERLPTGFVASVEPHPGFADGFPIELEGEVFLLAATRIGLPWESIAGVATDRSYRVELSDGERAIRLASGLFMEMPVRELALVRGLGRTHDVVDEQGAVVWSFDVPEGQTPLQAASGRFEMTWLQWDGDRFVAVERPWPDGHDVDIVPLEEGLLARSIGPLRRDVALWHSPDGRTWTSVEPPAEPLHRTPVALRGDGGGAIVTVFATGGFQAWATRDGADFDRLPDVPGLADRHRGDFGWIAADPRSAPTIRLSVDGRSWEELDIGPLLGLDASRWDVKITAAAHGDRIVVVADRSDGRSVLVGEVAPAD